MGLKKALKIVIGVVVTSIVLVGGGMTAIGLSVYDKRNILDEQVKNDNKSTLTVVNNKLYEATKDTSETDVKVLFTPKELEYLLYSIIKEIELDGIPVSLNGCRVTEESGAYAIEISGKAMGFPTVITAGLKMEEESGTISIQLTDAKMGKLEAVKGLGKTIINGLNTDKLTANLEKQGIFCSIDKSTLTVTMTKTDLQKTLLNLIPEEDTANLANMILAICLDNPSLLEFSLGDNDLFGATIHLRDAVYDADTMGALPYTYDYDPVITKEKTLLSNGVITTEQVSTVFHYLLTSYASLEEEQEKPMIDSIDFSSVGITNKSSYSGPLKKTSLRLSDYIVDMFKSSGSLIAKGGTNIFLADTILDEIFKSLAFVGAGYAYNDEATGDIGYITLEQFNIVSEGESAELMMIANVYGKQVYIRVALDTPSQKGLKIKGTITYAGIGSNELTSEQKTSLLNYLKAVFEKNELEWISVDESENVIFDFEKAISSSEVIAALLKVAGTDKITTSFINGGVNINISLF